MIKELMENGWNREIVSVKEKFGGLRFNIAEGNKTLYEIISKYEEESYHVCEITGNPGILRKDLMWMKTLSEEEYRKKIDTLFF